MTSRPESAREAGPWAAYGCLLFAVVYLVWTGSGPSAPLQAVAFACLVLATGSSAWRWASRLLPDASAPVFLLAAFSLAQAIAAGVVLWPGLVGGLTMPIVSGAVGVFGLVTSRFAGPPRRWRQLLPELPFLKGFHWTTVLVVLLFLCAYAVVVLNQLRYTVQDADSMWYHLVMPAEWIRTGSVWSHDAIPTMAKGYPGFRQSLVALLSLPSRNEHLALLGMIEFPLLALAAYCLARRLGSDRSLAVLVGACAATTPVVFAGSSTQGNDIALAIHLATSAVFCSRFFENGKAGDGWLAGIALGALAASKFSGPGYCVLVLATTLAQHGFSGWWSWRSLGLLAIGPIELAAPWYVRNWIALGNPLYPARIELLGIVLDGPVDKQFLATQTLGWNVAPLWQHLGFFQHAHGALAAFGAFGFLLVGIAVLRRRMAWRPAIIAMVLPPLLFVMFLHHPFNLPRFDAGYSHRYLIAWFTVSLAALAVGVSAFTARLTPVLSVVVGLSVLGGLRTVTGLWLPIGAAVVVAGIVLARPSVFERLSRYWRWLVQHRLPLPLAIVLLAICAAVIGSRRASWQYAAGVGYRDGSSELGWAGCMRYVHENIHGARIGLHGSHFLLPLIGEPWSNQVLIADQPLLGQDPKTSAEVAAWIEANDLDYIVCCRDRTRDQETRQWQFGRAIADELFRNPPANLRFETVFDDQGAHVLRIWPR